MRALGTDFKTENYASQTGSIYLTLLTIDYEGATAPLRFVNNYEPVTSNGNDFLSLAFTFTMPQDGKENRNASIVLDNVDRRVATFLLSSGADTVTVTEQLIEESTPNDIEIEREYIIKSSTITRKTVSCELSYEAYLQDSFPKLRKTPSTFPGIF